MKEQSMRAKTSLNDLGTTGNCRAWGKEWGQHTTFVNILAPSKGNRIRKLC